MTTNVAVTIGARRWVCVVDPSLAFGPDGPRVVRQLARTFEVWVFRELWHILDNTVYFARTPAVLVDGEDAGVAKERAALAALGEWERLRCEHDISGLRVYWVGDGVSESFLPEHHDARLVARFERLAAGLDEHQRGAVGRLASMAYRDAAALAGALDDAFVLVRIPQQRSSGEPPALMKFLAQRGIWCDHGDPEHPLLALERQSLRNCLADAGLARMCLTGLGLAAVHIVLPPMSDDTTELAAPLASEEPAQHVQPVGAVWNQARAVWYPIC